MKRCKGAPHPFRVQVRSARCRPGIGRPSLSNRPVVQVGQALHSGRTPRSQSGQTIGKRVTSRKEFRFVPHQGQLRIDSEIGPSQAWQLKRVSSVRP